MPLVVNIHFYERCALLWLSGDLKDYSEIKEKAKPSASCLMKKSHLGIYLHVSAGRIDKLFTSLLCMWLASFTITKRKGQTV